MLKAYMLVTKYWDMVYQNLDIAAAMRCMTATAALHYNVQNKPLPTVGHKYCQPLGRTFCNHARVAKQLTPEETTAILAAPCACEGALREYYVSHGLISQQCGHVVSCSAAALGPDCPTGLQVLFSHGPKHRPGSMSFTMTAAVKQQVYQDLKASFTAFATQHAAYAAWSEEVLREIRRILHDDDRFKDGATFTCRDRPHAQGTVFTPCLTSYDAVVAGLHEHFVITTADKLSYNYVVVCKKHYIQQVLADLGSGQFYAEMLAVAAQSALDRIVDSLLQRVNTVAGCMYHGLSDDRLRDLLHTLSYEAALVKLHKNPVALRFLACTGTNGLKKNCCMADTYVPCDT
jgi:hypothetical protein